MVLTKEVSVKISASNYAYYEEIGFNAGIGETIQVAWSMLSTGSHYKILCKCDICSVEKEVMYKNYLKYHNTKSGEYMCRKCSENKRKISLNENYNVDYPLQNDEIMDKMPADKQCIIVGVDHGGDFRLTEYNPYDSKYGKGRGNDYVDFLAKTLKPYIDSHYRTKKDPRYTAVAGSSMGGLISYYAVLKYPKVFGSSGIFSPAFWIAPDMVGFAQQKHLPRSTRFYFVCGDAESESMVSDMKKMADIIRSKGIPERETPIIIIKGAGHNEKQWNGDFPGFYSWFLQMP